MRRLYGGAARSSRPIAFQVCATTAGLSASNLTNWVQRAVTERGNRRASAVPVRARGRAGGGTSAMC